MRSYVIQLLILIADTDADYKLNTDRQKKKAPVFPLFTCCVQSCATPNGYLVIMSKGDHQPLFDVNSFTAINPPHRMTG